MRGKLVAHNQITVKEIAGLNLDPRLERRHCHELLGAANRFRSDVRLKPRVARVRDRLMEIQAHSRRLRRFLGRMRGSSHPGRRLKQIENEARQLAGLIGGPSEESLAALHHCFVFDWGKIYPTFFVRVLYDVGMLAKAGERQLLKSDVRGVVEILSELQGHCGNFG